MSLSFFASWSIITCTMLANLVQQLCLIAQASMAAMQLRVTAKGGKEQSNKRWHKQTVPNSYDRLNVPSGNWLSTVPSGWLWIWGNMQQIQAEVKHASTMSNCRWNQSDSNVPMHDLCDSRCVASHPCAWCLVNDRSPSPASERLAICPTAIKLQHNLLTCQAAPMHEERCWTCTRPAGVSAQSCWWPWNHSAWLQLDSLPSRAHRGSSVCHGPPK